MIYGPRLRLRSIERNDLRLFVHWFNDPEVTAGLLQVLPLSLAEEEAWYESVLKSPAEERPLMIEARMGDAWIPIGDLGLHHIDWRVREAEVGIVIGEKEYWNRGYGTEAMRLMLAHGFNTLNLNRIFLKVYETNPRAIRSYEKAGFIREGTLRQAMFKNGQYINVIIMGVLSAEWKG